MYHVLAHEYLVGHAHHLIFTVAVEDDYVVDVGTVADKLVLLESRADEAFLAVDIELLVCLYHLGCLNGVEIAYLCEPRMVLAVLVFEEGKPVGRHFHDVCKVAVHAFNLCLDACHQFVGLVFVELQYALHLYLQQAQYVVFGHLTHQLRIVWREPLVDMFAHGVHIRGLFKLPVLIYALLNEDFFERTEVQLL